MSILENKTILLTGAGQGIGRAAAHMCARAGAKMILVSRTENDLVSLSQELQEVSGKKHFYRAVDVSNFNAMQDLAQWVALSHSHLDGLVNCAGILGPIGRTDQIDWQAFNQTMQVNLMGTLYACQLFAPALTKVSGKIINFSGGGAVGTLPNYSAYACSKAAVVRLTENIAVEFEGLGIAVNAIAPGFVATRIHQGTLQAGDKAGIYLQDTQKQLEQGGVSPDVAAELIVWLLSEYSAGITGKIISAPWDNWKSSEFVARLRAEKNLCTMRRIDDKYFTELTN